MANVSDIIEHFILNVLGEEEKLNISRNELANYFSCAPSQINYVLSTRFTPARGYTFESRRGGGGFITVIKLQSNPNDIYDEIFSQQLVEGISYLKACQILERMEKNDYITVSEANILRAVLSDKSLIAPTPGSKNVLRLSALRSAYLEIMKE